MLNPRISTKSTASKETLSKVFTPNVGCALCFELSFRCEKIVKAPKTPCPSRSSGPNSAHDIGCMKHVLVFVRPANYSKI